MFYLNEILTFNIDQLANTKRMQSNESGKFCQRLTWIDLVSPISMIASALKWNPVESNGPADEVTNSTNILFVDEIILDLILPLK